MSPACPQCGNPVVSTATRCGRCGASFKPAKVDPNLGRTLGNLRLTEKIGTGGMGAVYRAEHVALGTPYAVKVLHRQFSDDETVAERFRREAVACSRLRHENTVFVTDFGVHDEVGIYLVMEYLEGVSLHDLLRAEGALPLGRFARFAAQVCDAMGAAHRLGIVHRDLKPENVMVLTDVGREDRVKVLDFGIAHLRDAGAAGAGSITRAGTVVGTPAYMAPEQIDRRQGPVTPSSDIYALGVIFYECLAGRRPFEGDSEIALITHQLTIVPDPVETHRPELAGSRLALLVRAMLEKRVDARPPTMEAVRATLAEAMKELEAAGLVEDLRITAPELPFERVAEGPRSNPSLSSPDLQRSNPSLQITGVLQRIRAEAPDSPAAALLAALPGVDAMRGEAITLALWGVLQDELLDAPPGDPRFARSLGHLALLLDATLASRQGERPSPAQEKVFRALKNLFALASADRQRAIAEGISPLFERPLFPTDALPKHLAPGRGSGWSAVRDVMTREINLWPAKKPDARSSAPPPPPETPEAPENPEASLSEKLKQPVSVSTMKAVLSHEIKLFGKNKG